MFKILKLFSLILLFICARLAAEPHLNLDHYLLFITDVDPEAHQFTLSNKMVFQVAKNNWGTNPFPEVGMEARIIPLTRNIDRFSLEEEGELAVASFFQLQKREVHVWMTEESKAHCLSYAGSQSRCIQPAGWFSSAIYEDMIVLSDGSKWVPEEEAQIPFIKGDRLILTNIDDHSWLLTNIDRSLFLTDSTNGKRYERIFGLIVHPSFQEAGSTD